MTHRPQVRQSEKPTVVVVGAGPAGMTAAITAARIGHPVTLIEKRPQPGAKLRASGGGKCNLTNTLAIDDFVDCCGRHGRFMLPALRAFSSDALRAFLAELGVQTHAPDGRRVFPTDHSSLTVVTALQKELKRLDIKFHASSRVTALTRDEDRITGVHTAEHFFHASNVILATGGLGYPSLGSEGDGYRLAQSVGHTVTELFPAMVPLHTRETWVSRCRADTIGHAELRIAGKRGLAATGDLIFTNKGIRGPLVLDVAREITPLLAKHGEVAVSINLVGGRNEEQMREQWRAAIAADSGQTVHHRLSAMTAPSVARELCSLADLDASLSLHAVPASRRDRLLRLVVAMPLTIVGHDGWEQAMVTRGGISLKEVDPQTLQSRLIQNLFFAGELLDLDGPCGGFNLQWAFASGFLAGHLGGR